MGVFEDGDFKFLGLETRFERKWRNRFWIFENGFHDAKSQIRYRNHGLGREILILEDIFRIEIFEKSKCPWTSILNDPLLKNYFTQTVRMKTTHLGFFAQKCCSGAVGPFKFVKTTKISICFA